MNRDLGIRGPTTQAPKDEVYAEKRRHPRRQLGVRCWLGDGRYTLYARVHDVSAGGFSIRAPVPFLPDAELTVALVLSGAVDDEQAQRAIRAMGRVVWVRQAPLEIAARGSRVLVPPGTPRMGAEFVRFDEGERLLLELVGAG